MKILVATWTETRVGGAETYVETVLHELCKRDCQVGCLFETAAAGKPAISVPHQAVTWTLSSSSTWETVRQSIQTWAPDVVYCHGLLDIELERWLQSLAPAVLFAHNYYGTCISGTKTFTHPAPKPCDRMFGAACLAFYFPCGCGGQNPLSMWRDYRAQQGRLSLLPNYKLICTASRHMAAEMNRHVKHKIAKVVRLPISNAQRCDVGRNEKLSERLASLQASDRPVRLLFLGRIEANKGPHRAMEAAPLIAKRLNRAVELTFVGEGSQANGLRSKTVHDDQVKIRWAGWLKDRVLEAEIARQDLLLVPSMWPEPFGLVGLEAASCGVPAVSFGFGGIQDWLIDGETGLLTRDQATTAEALADAAVRCLDSIENHTRISENAKQFADRWPDVSQHTDELTSLFKTIVAVAR